MDVVPLGSLRATSLLWRLRTGAWTQTVICKATFRLRPVESVLVDEPDPPNEEDNHWDDDPSRSLYSPSDLAPFKARADVLLVGNAFAPRKEPVRSLVVRLQIGELDKSIEVFCDRAWTREGQLRERARFHGMPLRYERAAGGPDTRNPVGLRHDGPPDAYGNVLIPNLQPLSATVATPADVISPIGFGPISPAWPERRDRLGGNAGAWPKPGWTEQPLPDGINPRYFNAAPTDQQVDSIRPNERIILENLSPEHPRLVTALPGIVPIAKVTRPSGAPEPLELRADTLWIDTNRGICTVTWRAQLQLASKDEPGTVSIMVQRPGAPEAAVSPEEDDAARTMIPVAPPRAQVMPRLRPDWEHSGRHSGLHNWGSTLWRIFGHIRHRWLDYIHPGGHCTANYCGVYQKIITLTSISWQQVSWQWTSAQRKAA